MIESTCLVGCKSCFQSEGVIHTINIHSPKKTLFSNGIKKSEYEITNLVSKNILERNYMCPFCSSKNIDIIELNINNEPIQVDKDTTQFQISLSRNNQGKIEVNFGGSSNLPPHFLTKAVSIIKTELNQIPANEFEYLETSDAFFCVSSESYLIDDEYQLLERLESFRFYGFAKTEIESNIDYAVSKLKDANPNYPF